MYDCGGTHLNITIISLVHTGDCELRIENTTTTDTYVQLLQLSNYNYVETLHCKIEISRNIYHCGMHFHVSMVHNGQANYLKEIPREQCKHMHRNGVLHLGTDGVIDNLKANETYYKSITMAGKIDNDGSCSGIQYSDYYGT